MFPPPDGKPSNCERGDTVSWVSMTFPVLNDSALWSCQAEIGPKLLFLFFDGICLDVFLSLRVHSNALVSLPVPAVRGVGLCCHCASVSLSRGFVSFTSEKEEIWSLIASPEGAGEVTRKLILNLALHLLCLCAEFQWLLFGKIMNDKTSASSWVSSVMYLRNLQIFLCLNHPTVCCCIL